MPPAPQPPRRGLVPAEPLARPGHGHQPSDAQPLRTRPAIDPVDPHPSWLKKWRCLRTDVGVDGDSERVRESVHDLQTKIAHTRAETLSGLQAQAELIAELAWNDIVAATARQLLAGIRRLQRSRRR